MFAAFTVVYYRLFGCDKMNGKIELEWKICFTLSVLEPISDAARMLLNHMLAL